MLLLRRPVARMSECLVWRLRRLEGSCHARRAVQRRTTAGASELHRSQCCPVAGMAEGFEPSGAGAPPTYQAGTIGHSVMPPRSGDVRDATSPQADPWATRSDDASLALYSSAAVALCQTQRDERTFDDGACIARWRDASPASYRRLEAHRLRGLKGCAELSARHKVGQSPTVPSSIPQSSTRRTAMPSQTIDFEQTSVPCPSGGCLRPLVRQVKQVVGTTKTFDDWICLTNPSHVTQQFEPPSAW